MPFFILLFISFRFFPFFGFYLKQIRISDFIISGLRCWMALGVVRWIFSFPPPPLYYTDLIFRDTLFGQKSVSKIFERGSSNRTIEGNGQGGSEFHWFLAPYLSSNLSNVWKNQHHSPRLSCSLHCHFSRFLQFCVMQLTTNEYIVVDKTGYMAWLLYTCTEQKTLKNEYVQRLFFATLPLSCRLQDSIGDC